MRSLVRHVGRLGPLLALVAVHALLAAAVPDGFAGSRNLAALAGQTAVLATAGLGMTLVMALGGIDLSVGSVAALSAVVIAALLRADVAPVWAAFAGVVAGGLCGLLTGLLVARARLAPFIVTLGMLPLFRGVARGLAGGEQLAGPAGWLDGLVAAGGPAGRWLLLPPAVWLTLVLAALVAGLLGVTRFGRHVLAIGSNERAARLCGVAVERTKTLVYMLGAGLAGLAGLLQFSRSNVGVPGAATGFELDVIAAVLIGGGRLNGGRGSVLGTLVGAWVVTALRAGCFQMGLPVWAQEILTGSIIVLAVALDRVRSAPAY